MSFNFKYENATYFPKAAYFLNFMTFVLYPFCSNFYLQDLFQELRGVELKIARAQSLKLKFRTSEANNSDIDSDAFVTSLLEKPEVDVVGGSRGPMGRVIRELFSSQEV